MCYFNVSDTTLNNKKKETFTHTMNFPRWKGKCPKTNTTNMFNK